MDELCYFSKDFNRGQTERQSVLNKENTIETTTQGIEKMATLLKSERFDKFKCFRHQITFVFHRLLK